MLEVRRFIADLRPGGMEQHGLAAALADYIRGYANAYDARVTLDTEPLPRLPRESEIVLYRIVQEALQNAHKYARGAQVSIRSQWCCSSNPQASRRAIGCRIGRAYADQPCNRCCSRYPCN